MELLARRRRIARFKVMRADAVDVAALRVMVNLRFLAPCIGNGRGDRYAVGLVYCVGVNLTPAVGNGEQFAARLDLDDDVPAHYVLTRYGRCPRP